MSFNESLLDDFSQIEDRTLRAKLLWEPKALPGFSAQLTFSDTYHLTPINDFVIEPFSDLTPRDANVPGTNAHEAQTTIIDLQYEFSPGVELSTQLRYSEFLIDLDGADSPRAGSQFFLIEGEDRGIETILRFEGPGGRLSGLAGFNYSETDQDERVAFLDPTFQLIKDQKTSLGIFAEASYFVTDRVEVTGGFRYQRDTQDREGSFIFADVDFDREFDAFLPTFQIAYDYSDKTRFGFAAARGFNPGGFTADFFTGDVDEYDAEFVWNYELFVRSSTLGGRLNFAGNLFYSDWTDFQKSTVTGFDPISGAPVFENDNIDAVSYGLELQADYQLNDSWLLYGSLGLLQTDFDEAVAPGVVESREFGRAPSYTIVAGFDYAPNDQLTLSAQVRHSDGYFTDDDNNPLNRISEFTLVDVSARYDFKNGARAYLYIENLLDDTSPTQVFQQAPFGSIGSVTTPRTIGFGIDYTF